MTRIHLDFETRSPQPFGRQPGAVTAYQYARDPNTGVWCLFYAVDDAPVRGWTPWLGLPFPQVLIDAVRDGATVCAHNAGFEWCIWNYTLARDYDLPPLDIEQMDCTAARAAIMALPRSLEDACKAMGLAVEKDKEGAGLMQRMAKPRKVHEVDPSTEAGAAFIAEAASDPQTYTIDPSHTRVYEWWATPDRTARLGTYCARDVEAERGLDEALVPMTRLGRRNWLLVHRTNMRGVRIDTELARRCQAVMAVIEERYRDELFDLTDGKVAAVTEIAQMKAWLEGRGVTVDSLDKAHVTALRRDHPDDDAVQRVLEIRQEAGKSSVAKLRRFLELTAEDGRMRENFLFHGAAPGRLAGKGAQLQNLPSRTGLKWHIAEAVAAIILEYDDPAAAAALIELAYGPIPEAISSCLRAHLIAAPGKRQYVADFSNIEGRVAAWFGDEDWKLDAFRLFDAGLGPDLYKVTAAMILGILADEVDGTQRSILGKVPELALGFQGGVGAFVSMGANFGIRMADYWDIIRAALDPRYIEKAHENFERFGVRSAVPKEEWLPSEAVKLAWRARHPGIVKCWYDAEECAVEALKHPGQWYAFAGGRCAFGATSITGVPFLICRLPNKRRIYRAHAKLKIEERFGREKAVIHYWGVDSVTRRWMPMTTYGGDLFQSAVQGTAFDLMMNGWANVEDTGYGVTLSVHDELAAEADEDRDLSEFITEMSRLPSWAAGCPVTAAGYAAHRYRKD